jgi:transcriptional regulator with XRE-family HTH domain
VADKSEGDSFGALMKALRDEVGFTLRQVEERCKISNGYLSLIENNKVKEPSPRILYALAECYHTDYLDLMRRAGYPVPDRSKDASSPPIVFRGAERLTESERQEIQDLISVKLRRRQVKE